MNEASKRIVSLFKCPSCNGKLKEIPSKDEWLSPSNDFECEDCQYTIPYIDNVPLFVPLHSIGWVGIDRVSSYWETTDKSIPFDKFYEIMQEFSNPANNEIEHLTRLSAMYRSNEAEEFDKHVMNDKYIKSFCKLYADPVYSWITENIKSYLTTSSVIMDIGIGGGDTEINITNILEEDSTFIGIDIDIRAALRMNRYIDKKMELGQVILACADFRNLPLKDNSVDIIVSSGGLSHMDGFSIVLENITRVLKPNGVVILVEFNNRIINPSIEELVEAYDIPNGYKNLMDRFLSKGYVTVKTEEVGIIQPTKQTGSILKLKK